MVIDNGRQRTGCSEVRKSVGRPVGSELVEQAIRRLDWQLADGRLLERMWRGGQAGDVVAFQVGTILWTIRKGKGDKLRERTKEEWRAGTFNEPPRSFPSWLHLLPSFNRT